MDNFTSNITQEIDKRFDEEIPHVLVVDDEEPVQRMLKRLLCNNGNRCTLVSSTEEARECMVDQDFDLILCDMDLPGESGIDFSRYALAEHPDTAVIIVTSEEDPAVGQAALEIGAYGYIIKPFKPTELVINIYNALRRRKIEIQNRNNRRKLEQAVLESTKVFWSVLSDFQEIMKDTIQAMASTVETRDPYTAGHQQRVAYLAVALAKDIGLSVEQVIGIRMAGMIHDLGKIAVPAEILGKPGPLTDSEYDLIKTHPHTGYDLLKDIKCPWPIAKVTLQHHERLDGSGYPQGLKGKDICTEAKILSVANVVEAMTSHRPYRPALGIDLVLEEITLNRGTLYEPEVVDACENLFTDKGFKWSC